MMTDAHLIRNFQTNQLSSSGLWNAVNESGADESAPSITTPSPSMHHSPSAELSAAFDPTLCITPERTLSSRAAVQRTISGFPEDDCDSNRRAPKVHFDQTVSVHHLSPEYGSNGESLDDFYLSDLNSERLSSVCDELDALNTEPISVIASDLRRFSPNSASLMGELESTRILQRNILDGQNLPADRRRKKRSTLHSRPRTEVPVEWGNNGGMLASSSDSGHDDEPLVEPECVLARPEYNSTLKMSDEISQLKEQQFDAVAKENISPKLKQQVFEKVFLLIFLSLQIVFIILNGIFPCVNTRAEHFSDPHAAFCQLNSSWTVPTTVQCS